jgi:spermidine/putrescine-binding protein
VWSGDLVNAQYYMEKGVPTSTLRYWTPKTGEVVGSDTMAVLKGAQKPVLAHMFLDYLLGPKIALQNFGWVGYQPPLNAIEPDKMVSEGLVPDNVASAVVRKADFDEGETILPLTVAGDVMWHDAWSEFKGG